MEIKQFDIWIANLNPKIGTEPGKTRPVLGGSDEFIEQDTAPIDNNLCDNLKRKKRFQNLKGSPDKRHCKHTPVV